MRIISNIQRRSYSFISIVLIYIIGFSSVSVTMLNAQEDVDLFDMNISTRSTTNSESSDTNEFSSEYQIGENDEIFINVNIWGEVRKTGMYKVPSTTDLLKLISLTGGPLKNADIGAIKIVRLNLEEGDESIIYVDLEEYLQTANYDLIPILRPGDTIVVPGNFLSYFGDFVDLVAKVALIVNVYVAVSNLSK